MKTYELRGSFRAMQLGSDDCDMRELFHDPSWLIGCRIERTVYGGPDEFTFEFHDGSEVKAAHGDWIVFLASNRPIIVHREAMRQLLGKMRVPFNT